jgi:hypothetical protein
MCCQFVQDRRQKKDTISLVGRYRHLDRTLTLKHGMTFEEFMGRRVVQQEGYTWDVEKDAMDWETAVDASFSGAFMACGKVPGTYTL